MTSTQTTTKAPAAAAQVAPKPFEARALCQQQTRAFAADALTVFAAYGL